MYFEFSPDPDFDFLQSFSKTFQAKIIENTLVIPKELGTGTIKKVELGGGYKFLIHRYILNDDFVLKRIPAGQPHNLVSIIFNGNEDPVNQHVKNSHVEIARNSAHAIEIASADLDSVIRFPANTEISFTVIGIPATMLNELLEIKKPNNTVETILSDRQGYLFYERMDTDMKLVLDHLTQTRSPGELNNFYSKIKIQELLYFIFEKLQQRDTNQHNPVNAEDIEKLFKVKASILTDLSEQPRLPQLSMLVGLSETKMSVLFKQVFGDSIYNYYQKARMREAAFLLRHGGHSVSETGYKLGFTNLSHFSRLFDKHVGMKPKKYIMGE